MPTPNRGTYTVDAVPSDSPHTEFLGFHGIKPGASFQVIRLAPLTILTPHGMQLDLRPEQWDAISATPAP